MVYVGDKKYACETCIKGHRSSSCKHTDRPLFEIKKKGRPVTQCEHCRELRKTRQIHVKCLCETKDAGEGAASSSQGGVKLPACAAFPSGLPEELLGASVACQPFSEGSDSEHSNRECCCKESGSCTCWTPRVRAKSSAKTPARRSFETRPMGSHLSDRVTQPAALVAEAHSRHARPVLPKPPSESISSTSKTSRDPSSIPGSRLSTHGQSFYSPYNRAYEYSHGSSYPIVVESFPSNILNASPNSSTPFDSWALGEDTAYPGSPSICRCGSSCACPGCVEHSGPATDPSAACSNPDTCSACLDCNISALTALTVDTTSTIYDPSQMQNIDEWLRQVSSMPDLSSSAIQSEPPVFPSTGTQSQPDLRYDAAMIQFSGMWSNTQASSPFSPTIIEECCGGRCKCTSGMCACPSDCCGCCQGCECNDCVPDIRSGRTLTFATSGERGPCCGSGGRSAGAVSSSVAGPSRRASSAAASVPPMSPSGTWLTPNMLTVPRLSLSRASSSSSKSSALPSTSSSPGPFGDMSDTAQRPGAMDPAVGSCCSSMGNLSTGPPNMSGGGPSWSHRRGSDHNEYRTNDSKYTRRF